MLVKNFRCRTLFLASAMTLVFVALVPAAMAQSAAVTFLDRDGKPVTDYLEGSVVFVRVEDPFGHDLSSITVNVTSTLAGDFEYLTLYSGREPGVFEGRIGLDPGGQAGPNPGLQTALDPGPPVVRDTVTVDYEGTVAAIGLVGARTRFFDPVGSPATELAAGLPIHVQVADYRYGDPAVQDSFPLDVYLVSDPAVKRTATMTETGPDTGLFEGLVANDDYWAAAGGQIAAQHVDADGVVASASADVVVCVVRFVDAGGRPAAAYRDGSRAYLRAFDPGSNWTPNYADSSTVTVTSTVAGDYEYLDLLETGTDSGVFEGSVDLEVGTNQPGSVETYRQVGPPDVFDTLTAESASCGATATAGTVGARISFIDEAGHEEGRFALGSRARVRLEGVSASALRESAQVTLTASSGDSETLTLTETGLDDGVFEGSMRLADPFYPEPDPGLLQAAARDTIDVSFQDGSLTPSASARVEEVDLVFVDESGLPVRELPENGFVRLRRSGADYFTAEIASLEGQDTEYVSFYTAGANSAEGTIDLSRAVATSFDVLETWTSGAPLRLTDEVRASGYLLDPLALVARAPTRSSRIALLDYFGRETSDVYLAGDDVRVRVVDFNRSTDENVRETLTVTVRAGNGDVEILQLLESDLNNAVFEGTLPGGFEANSPGDGVLGYLDGTLEVAYQNVDGVTESVVRAPVVENLFYLLGQDGLPTERAAQGVDVRIATRRILYGSDLYTDSYYVELRTLLAGDEEYALVIETGPDTDFYTGTVQLNLELGPVTTFDGVVSVAETAGANDALELSYAYKTPQSVTVESVGADLRFVDAQGNAAEAFAERSTLYLELVDPRRQKTPSFDTVDVSIRSLVSGDVETLTLGETGPSSVTWAGFVELDSAPPVPGDGLLQALPGEQVEALYVFENGLFENRSRAEVVEALLVIVDENGVATDVLLEDGELRARLADADAGFDPDFPDLVLVEARSLNGLGTTSLNLVETGNDTGVFEGSLPLSSSYTAGALVTAAGGPPHYLPEKVTVIHNKNGRNYGDSATVAESRLHLVDASSESVESYLLGDEVRVRVEDHNHDLNPTQADSFVVTLTTSSGDVEDVTVTELGVRSGVFEGSSSSAPGSTAAQDGVLQGVPGATVEASFVNLEVPATTRDRATFGNRPPTAADDTASTLPGQFVDVFVLDNDADPEGGALSLVDYTQPANGWTVQVTVSGVGTGIRYTPDAGFTGTNTFTYVAQDPGGGQDQATVTVTVNTPPSVVITAPADGTVVTQGAGATLTGTAGDTEDGDLGAAISWSSSLDGALGTGATLPVSGLALGVHTITASVTDSLGGTASDAITLTVDGPPTVAITAPADGTVVDDGDIVGFTGTASDPEDGDLAAAIAWSSSLDGALGTGATLSTPALSVGVHTITATVSDSRGTPATATITVTVNGLPAVAITAPANGSVFLQGASVGFSGTAGDPEDGDLSGSITWTSSLDGALGTGATLSSAGLSLGTHTITAAVTDSRGAGASDAITLTVHTAPVVTVTGPADGSTVAVGDQVTFTGSAVDLEDGDLGASLTWTSNLDGLIGTGGTFSTTALSGGTHLVTASVTDSLGAAGADTVTVIVKVPVVVTFTSNAAEDGWVLESSETSGAGASVADTGNGPNGDKGIRGGDDKKDKQYRGFLSFDTAAIPDGAALRSASLRLRRLTVVGTSPFVTHGALSVDVKTGGFGTSTALEAGDFEATATAAGVSTLSDAPTDDDWSQGTFDAAGLAALNLTGTTQVRIAFGLDDNDDHGDDYVEYYPGDHSVPSNRPQLVVEYLE